MNQRKYFYTFDALRFFAFFCVFISHLPFFDFPYLSFFGKSGGIGVYFFFVLSGFLITYILLYEKQTTGSVDLKNFFVRRILRIWPLFYAMILFAYLTPTIVGLLGLSQSNVGYEPNWLISCLFLENYKMMHTNSHPNVSPLGVMWSLCIEEHFYIIWGLVFYLIKIVRVPYVIAGAILVANVSRLLYPESGFGDVFTNLDYFAYGAIPAYCLIKKQKILDFFINLPGYFKYISASVTTAYVFISPNTKFPLQQFADPFIFGTLFMVLIFFTLPSTNRLYIKDSHIVSRLGIYTYGLYLFHTIFINLLIQVYKMLGIDLYNVFHQFHLSIAALSLTLLASYLSYLLYESQFLKLKKHFKTRQISTFASIK